jgi:hypothetical protein
LPVPYNHLVFTLPAAIAEIAYQNKAAIYAILFKASAETLMTIAADPKHLGTRIGVISVYQVLTRSVVRSADRVADPALIRRPRGQRTPVLTLHLNDSDPDGPTRKAEAHVIDFFRKRLVAA